MPFALTPWLPLSVLTWATMMVVYHGVGLLFEWCDRTGRLRRFKVRDIDRLSYGQLLPRVVWNQVFILLPAMVLLQTTGLAFVGSTRIGVLHFTAAIVVMGVGHDIVQYVFHRFVLHNPRWIRTLGHSLHHATGASKAISACYMSPIDFVLEIVLPYLVPLVVVVAGGNVVFHLLVAGLGAVGGLYEHSGYDFARALERPGLAGWRGVVAGLVTSQAHGEHHRRSSVSFSDGFGSPGLCDTLFETRWDRVDDAGLPRRPPGVAAK
jgi:sterol desaturase/sphingolipid hydroxylase (fatty acid hydroxylase superfamily)